MFSHLTSLIFSVLRNSPRTLKGYDAPEIKTCIQGSAAIQFPSCKIAKEAFIENGLKRCEPVLSAPGGKYTVLLVKPESAGEITLSERNTLAYGNGIVAMLDPEKRTYDASEVQLLAEIGPWYHYNDYKPEFVYTNETLNEYYYRAVRA